MRLPWLSSMLLVAAACSSPSAAPADPPCVAGLTTACQPLYSPATYDVLFTKVLQPNCAVGTGTCHTSDAAQGGLVLQDIDAAYAMLLGKDGSHPRVLPGDPGCSLLMKHLESTDPSYHMPKGPNSLSAPALCAITQWIAGGALR